jgi:hypothetical protein
MTERDELNTTDKDDAEAGSQVTEQRRRLLKLGVTAAPLILTLRSRSVLACHCKSPSAGGSLTYASHRPNDPTEGWDISNSVHNFRYWTQKGVQLPGTCAITKKTLLCKVPYIGVSFSSEYTEIKLLTDTFQQDMVTAYLNLCNTPTAQSNCLSFSQLQVMASGKYIDPASGISFDKQQIHDYLNANYLLG